MVYSAVVETPEIAETTEKADVAIPYAGPSTTTSSPMRRSLAQPVGWPLAVSVGLCSALTLYAESGPSGYFFLEMASGFLWIVIAGVWFLRTLIALLLRPSATRWKSAWRYAVVPVVLIITLTLVSTDVPARIAFASSKSELERIARVELHSADGNALLAYVGLYGECDFTHDGNAVTIRVNGAGYLDSEGFAFCPIGTPNGAGRYDHLEGPWYRWHFRF